ncbi:MAG: ABC transporter ATP-binding protein [Saprospiraceae bacterium]|jgi:putative ABC transport system ATP-binding protein|nr:ABC transporter ATP-binding protein [Saprospiraceae bacterium]MBP6566979.1 ABC transporter ATP-binding protein [Saprospiraceae bacterium]
MIECINVSKHVSKGTQKTFILQNINVKIEEGEFVSIMGPSGSGKSTLLHILGLLEDASGGIYRLQGEEVQSLNEKKKNDIHRNVIGFVFQAYHLIDELTVYENIETPLLYKKMNAAERKSIIADLLDKFQMVAKKDLFPHQLSGGQQQLVGIARALAIHPKLILADEPTGNLHSEQAEEIMQLFKRLNEKEGITIVQVTHSEYNASFGNRIIKLKDGWIS